MSGRDLYERKSKGLCDQLNASDGEGGFKGDSDGSHLAAVSQLPVLVSWWQRHCLDFRRDKLLVQNSSFAKDVSITPYGYI